MKTTLLLWTGLLIVPLFTACKKDELPPPNILWITSEDNGPFLGCYGDAFATTPNLDRMAAEGFRYTRAYANTPVCAPARNTIITGVYACSSGNEQMRSQYPRSETVRFYTGYLQEKGYYCTNNSKTDYNTTPADPETMWDESSRQAHYRNRAEGQPFFAIFNLTTSHESSIHTPVPSEQLRHRPEEVTLPPYHPDTPEMRHDWAQYYDRVEEMDAQVGELLRELEQEGLAENTIVFYYSDHGGVLGRSKRFLYETGTHVPFIVRIPEQYKHLYPAEEPGAAVDRLISFVDLAPTLLSLTGTEAPGYMQGRAFLGKYQMEAPAYIYMYRDRMDERYDMSRSVVDGRFRYTINFNPSRIYLQHLDYLWRAPSMRSWEKAYLDGECNGVQSRWWQPKPAEELYDVVNDPWEVSNLATDPRYQEQLALMRQECLSIGRSILDAGYLPEADRNIRAGGRPVYDLMRSGEVPLDEIIAAAVLASSANPAHLVELVGMLSHEDGAVRYWAMQGLVLLGDRVLPYTGEIARAAGDPSWNVRVGAAEILYQLGERETAIEAYTSVLRSDEQKARLHALNSLDHVGARPEEILAECLKMAQEKYTSFDRGTDYDIRALSWLLEKWGLDPAAYGIDLS